MCLFLIGRVHRFVENKKSDEIKEIYKNHSRKLIIPIVQVHFFDQPRKESMDNVIDIGRSKTGL